MVANHFHNPIFYKEIVGALQYMTLTRPNIAFTLNKVCQFMHDPIDDPI